MKENVETSLEAFAELMAALAGPFSERAATLASAGLDEAALHRVSTRWKERFAADAKSPEGSARRFAGVYARAREQYQARRRSIADAAPEQLRDARFLNADAQPFRAEAAAVPLVGSGEYSPAIQPFAPSSSVPAAVPLVVGPSPWAVAREAIPLREAPCSYAHDNVGATLPPSLSTGDPLPFEANHGPAAHTLQRAAAHARMVQGPAAPVRQYDGSGTVAIGAILQAPVSSPGNATQVLPPTLSPAASATSSPYFPEGSPPSSAGRWTQGLTSSHETVNLSATPNGVDQTLPLEPSGRSTKGSSLTLEQYASLCAELAVYPERKADILPRYGLNGDAGRQVEDAVWMRRLSLGGGQMAKQWQDLVIRYREWLDQQRRV